MRRDQFSYEELNGFCMGLAHLLHAGLTTGDAMALLAQDETDEDRKALYGEIGLRSDGGEALSAILADTGRFPAYVSAIVSTGEETGRLEEACFALAEYYEGRARMEHQLSTALFQPVALMAVLLVVLIVLLGWVLPVFDDVYRQLGSSLTGIAGALLALGSVFRRGLPVLLILGCALGFGAVWLVGSSRGREKLWAVIGDRGAFARMETVRLAQVLDMAVNSGLDWERAMELAVQLDEGDTGFRRKCEDCLERLKGQESLPKALLNSGLFSAADCRLLEAGVRSGCADTVMTQLKEKIRQRSEAQTEQWLSRIEPAMVMAASLMVGVILLSVLLPLTQIMAAIG